MEVTAKFNELKDHVKEYVQTRVDILTLTAADKGTKVVSNAVLYSILGFIGVFFFLFLNIGLALLLSDIIGNSYSGFLIISGFYLVLGIILFVMRDKWIKAPIVNTMLKAFFGKGAEDAN